MPRTMLARRPFCCRGGFVSGSSLAACTLCNNVSQAALTSTFRAPASLRIGLPLLPAGNSLDFDDRAGDAGTHSICPLACRPLQPLDYAPAMSLVSCSDGHVCLWADSTCGRYLPRSDPRPCPLPGDGAAKKNLTPLLPGRCCARTCVTAGGQRRRCMPTRREACAGTALHRSSAPRHVLSSRHARRCVTESPTIPLSLSPSRCVRLWGLAVARVCNRSCRPTMPAVDRVEYLFVEFAAGHGLENAHAPRHWIDALRTTCIPPSYPHGSTSNRIHTPHMAGSDERHLSDPTNTCRST